MSSSDRKLNDICKDLTDYYLYVIDYELRRAFFCVFGHCDIDKLRKIADEGRIKRISFPYYDMDELMIDGKLVLRITFARFQFDNPKVERFYEDARPSR